MKLRFLVAGIFATGLFASMPDAVAQGRGGAGHGGGGFHSAGGFRGFRAGSFHSIDRAQKLRDKY